jgi:hypothetical protein
MGHPLKVREVFSRYSRYVRFHRFLKYVRVGELSECWIWQGGRSGEYGKFGWGNGEVVKAHVAAYRLFVGHVPKRDGKRLYVCHNCPDGDNPMCVNPSHLWLGDCRQNIQDMDKKGRRVTPARNGENNGRSLLTYNQVVRIRKLKKKGYGYNHLSRKFGVAYNVIWSIINGRTWKQ